MVTRPKLSLDPTLAPPPVIAVESRALATWYDAHPQIRRLWGIREAQTLRVIVSVEPTLDDSDVYPAWIGNSLSWARELSSSIGTPVQLELIDESHADGIEIDEHSVVIADLFWRDATLILPRTMVQS